MVLIYYILIHIRQKIVGKNKYATPLTQTKPNENKQKNIAYVRHFFFNSDVVLFNVNKTYII